MNFLLISYYADLSDGAYYRNHAIRLTQSLASLGIHSCIEAISSRGSYKDNCSYKPEFIRAKLCELKKPVLWIDVDSIIHRKLSAFDNLDPFVDVAVTSPLNDLSRAKASPLFFNYTGGALEFLSRWIDRIQENQVDGRAAFDHEPLLEVIAQFKQWIRLISVGEEYCAREGDGQQRPVITMGLSSSASKNEAFRRITNQTRVAPRKPSSRKRPNLLGTGFPFEPRHSSCGLKRPQYFNWTADEREETMGIIVCMDRAIVEGTRMSTRRRKVAWFVESREIQQAVSSFVRTNAAVVEESYDFFFTCDAELASCLSNAIILPTASNLPWSPPVDPMKLQKTKLCSMFCSKKVMTDGHKLRHQIARQFMGRVALFGGALGSTKLGAGLFPDKTAALRDYMFHIAIENSFYDYYYTEKITDCFANCVIPIYKGCPSISEIFNREGIIELKESFDARELTCEFYQAKNDAVLDNHERTLALLSADDILFLHLTGLF